MRSQINKSLKITKKIVHIKLTIAVLLILPLVVATLLTSKTDRLAGIRSMVVLSGSMTPSLPVGSVVYVQKSPVYNKGDVISFSTDKGVTVTHRIMEVTKDIKGKTQFVTKGDVNNTQDKELVSMDNVIGKSMLNVPYLGYAI